MHGRGHLHGGRGAVLYGICAGRKLRQVRGLPSGHQAHAGDTGAHHPGQGRRRRHIEKLIELGNVIKDTALCGLGQTAAQPGAVHY